MAKEKKPGFFAEFKAFIMRGNIVDMAIGVIIAGAFTKIVTSLTNDIFMPIINWIVSLITGGKDVLLISVLNGKPYFIEETVDGEVVKTVNSECIYINWSNFIEAIINFLLIALILFIIVKTINNVHKKLEARKAEMEAKLHAEEIAKKEAEEKEKAEIEAKEAEEKAALQAKLDKEKAESMTTNELLVELINKLSK